MKLLIEKVSDLNDLLMEGESLQALDRFYHQEVVIQKNDEAPVKGKATNRKIMESELNDILEFKSAKPLHVAFGEQTTMVEWHLNYKHRRYGERNYTQVAVQDWKEGLIIKEKLYCEIKIT